MTRRQRNISKNIIFVIVFLGLTFLLCGLFIVYPILLQEQSNSTKLNTIIAYLQLFVGLSLGIAAFWLAGEQVKIGIRQIKLSDEQKKISDTQMKINKLLYNKEKIEKVLSSLVKKHYTKLNDGGLKKGDPELEEFNKPAVDKQKIDKQLDELMTT